VEVGKLRHDDMIAARLIIGLGTEVLEGDGHAGKERVQFGVALVGIGRGDDGQGGRIFRLDAVDLLGIEDGVALEERHLTLAILAALRPPVPCCRRSPRSCWHRRRLTFFALADAAAERERLLEGQPMRGSIALRHGGNPKGQDVDAAIGNARRAQRDGGCGAAVPRFRPGRVPASIMAII
jgi:hypothetical protein